MSKSFLTQEEFISKLPLVRTYKIVGPYTGVRNKLLTEDEYGVCAVYPYNLINGTMPSIQAAVVKTTYFINKARKIHGDKYDYSEVTYTTNKAEIVLICKDHGRFGIRPDSHLNGRGCPSCGKLNIGWSKLDFINKAAGSMCICYTIKCWNDNEEFYKIGITSLSLRKRFSSKTAMPYSYEVIKEIKGSADFVWDKEKELHKKYKHFKYRPQIQFNGVTECFSKIKNIKQ